MSQKIEDIVDSMLVLPVNSRAYLAEVLLESLDFEEDFPVDNEWMKEIKSRCQEIDMGKVKMVSGEEGFTQLQRKIL